MTDTSDSDEIRDDRTVIDIDIDRYNDFGVFPIVHEKTKIGSISRKRDSLHLTINVDDVVVHVYGDLSASTCSLTAPKTKISLYGAVSCKLFESHSPELDFQNNCSVSEKTVIVTSVLTFGDTTEQSIPIECLFQGHCEVQTDKLIVDSRAALTFKDSLSHKSDRKIIVKLDMVVEDQSTVTIANAMLQLGKLDVHCGSLFLRSSQITARNVLVGESSTIDIEDTVLKIEENLSITHADSITITRSELNAKQNIMLHSESELVTNINDTTIIAAYIGINCLSEFKGGKLKSAKIVLFKNFIIHSLSCEFDELNMDGVKAELIDCVFLGSKFFLNSKNNDVSFRNAELGIKRLVQQGKLTFIKSKIVDFDGSSTAHTIMGLCQLEASTWHSAAPIYGHLKAKLKLDEGSELKSMALSGRCNIELRNSRQTHQAILLSEGHCDASGSKVVSEDLMFFENMMTRLKDKSRFSVGTAILSGGQAEIKGGSVLECKEDFFTSRIKLLVDNSTVSGKRFFLDGKITGKNGAKFTADEIAIYNQFRLEANSRVSARSRIFSTADSSVSIIQSIIDAPSINLDGLYKIIDSKIKNVHVKSYVRTMIDVRMEHIKQAYPNVFLAFYLDYVRPLIDNTDLSNAIDTIIEGNIDQVKAGFKKVKKVSADRLTQAYCLLVDYACIVFSYIQMIVNIIKTMTPLGVMGFVIENLLLPFIRCSHNHDYITLDQTEPPAIQGMQFRSVKSGLLGAVSDYLNKSSENLLSNNSQADQDKFRIADSNEAKLIFISPSAHIEEVVNPSKGIKAKHSVFLLKQDKISGYFAYNKKQTTPDNILVCINDFHQQNANCSSKSIESGLSWLLTASTIITDPISYLMSKIISSYVFKQLRHIMHMTTAAFKKYVLDYLDNLLSEDGQIGQLINQLINLPKLTVNYVKKIIARIRAWADEYPINFTVIIYALRRVILEAAGMLCQKIVSTAVELSYSGIQWALNSSSMSVPSVPMSDEVSEQKIDRVVHVHTGASETKDQPRVVIIPPAADASETKKQPRVIIVSRVPSDIPASRLPSGEMEKRAAKTLEKSLAISRRVVDIETKKEINNLTKRMLAEIDGYIEQYNKLIAKNEQEIKELKRKSQLEISGIHKQIDAIHHATRREQEDQHLNLIKISIDYKIKEVELEIINQDKKIRLELIKLLETSFGKFDKIEEENFLEKLVQFVEKIDTCDSSNINALSKELHQIFFSLEDQSIVANYSNQFHAMQLEIKKLISIKQKINLKDKLAALKKEQLRISSCVSCEEVFRSPESKGILSDIFNKLKKEIPMPAKLKEVSDNEESGSENEKNYPVVPAAGGGLVKRDDSDNESEQEDEQEKRKGKGKMVPKSSSDSLVSANTSNAMQAVATTANAYATYHQSQSNLQISKEKTAQVNTKVKSKAELQKAEHAHVAAENEKARKEEAKKLALQKKQHVDTHGLNVIKAEADITNTQKELALKGDEIKNSRQNKKEDREDKAREEEKKREHEIVILGMQQDQDKLKQENEKLKKKYGQLKQGNNQLKEEHEKLKREHEEMSREVARLKQQLQSSAQMGGFPGAQSAFYPAPPMQQYPQGYPDNQSVVFHQGMPAYMQQPPQQAGPYYNNGPIANQAPLPNGGMTPQFAPPSQGSFAAQGGNYDPSFVSRNGRPMGQQQQYPGTPVQQNQHQQSVDNPQGQNLNRGGGI